MNEQHARELHSYLTEAITLSQALLQLLENEKQLLAQHKPYELSPITDAKHPLIDNLTRIKQHIERYLPSGSVKDFPSLLSACPPALAQQLVNLWDNFKHVSKRCQEQNNINGAMIAATLQHNQQLKRLLKGQTAQDATYDQRGRL